MPRRGRSRKLVVFAMSASTFAIAVCVALLVSSRSGNKAAALPKPAPPPGVIELPAQQRSSIVTGAVRTSDLPVRISVAGTVDFNANRVTPVFSQFSGRVARLDAEVGTAVRQGQVLAMLDSPDIVGIQADYQQALAAQRAAGVSLQVATQARERAARLAAAEAIPQRELQEAQAAEARATEDFQRAQASVVAIRGKLQIGGFSEEDIAKLESGGALSISRLVPLTSPVAGRIVERNLGLGQVVQAGGAALFKVADLSTVWVNADVFEDQIASVHPGSEVLIQTQAYPGKTFAARIDRIAPMLDPEKRTVAVRCVVPNPAGLLKPGMFATLTLRSGTVQQALLVPLSAVISSGDRRIVFVEKQPGIFQARAVQTGAESAGDVVVESGLQPGERVVVQGGLLLSQQMSESEGAQ